MKFFGTIAAVIVVATTMGCSSAHKSKFPQTIEEAVSNNHFRSPQNMARDQYRHPTETLKFFGVQPEMTIVEITPGAGWYTEILAPYLAQKGHFIAAGFPQNTEVEYLKNINEKFNTWKKSHPELEKKIHMTVFNPPTDPIAPEGTADMVLTFRNVHNWAAKGSEAAAFEAFFKALKPGGILGVVEHRADEKSKKDPKFKSGYMKESDVIRIAEKAGFKLQEKSEINANPKDTRNHPEGVWTLPPALRLGDKDKEKYMAMGESDRMTLRFVKPN